MSADPRIPLRDVDSLALWGRRHGIGQYRPPLSFVLSGQVFTLVEADGSALVVDFVDRERVTVTAAGVTELSYYACLPAARDVYFVSLEVAARFVILDLARGHGVIVDVSTGTRTVYAIAGLRLPQDIAATSTDDMVGTSISWVVGDGHDLQQRFTTATSIRQSWSPRHDKQRECLAACISLGDGLFVVDVEGYAAPGLSIPQGLGRLVAVQDFERVVIVGAVFSTVFNERILFGGYGDFESMN